jgi:hypothetical protein
MSSADEEEFPGLLPRRRRWPWVVAVVAAVIVGVGGLRYRRRGFDPGATEVGQRIGLELPARVAALAQARTPAETDALVADLEARTLTPGAREALGPEALGKLTATLAAARTLTVEQGGFEGAPAQGFLLASGALGQALLDRRSSYFLDGDVHGAGARSQPLLLSFYVERDAEVAVGDQLVRALHVWRLDRLSLTQGALGYTRPTTPAALVLLDQIESELVLYVLPSLPEGEPMVLVDDESLDADEVWQRELHEGVARVVRATFSAGADTVSVREIGGILARRRALIARWRRSTAAMRMRMLVPERLIPEADYRSDLDRLVPTTELLEWDEMHDRLSSRELEGAFVRMRDRFAAGVERHEVQHRVDFHEGLAPLPEDVRTWLLVDEEGSAHQFTGFGARVRMETSAYLAALASSSQSGRLDLALTARHLFNKHEQGNAYSYAGLVILGEMARELGVDTGGPFLVRRHIDRPLAARVLLGCLAHPDEAVSAAAGRAWTRLFGHPLPAARTTAARPGTPWRH